MTDKIDKTAAPKSEKTPSRFRRFGGRKRILTLAVLTGCFVAASWFVPISALWTAERERASSVRLLEEFLPQAILDGDGETALELAKKIDERPFPYLGRLNVKILCRGVAFELNGDYEKSLEAYRLASSRADVDAKNDAEPTDVDSFLGRVYYRLDRRADAFAAYCRLAESARKRAAETSENSRIGEAARSFRVRARQAFAARPVRRLRRILEFCRNGVQTRRRAGKIRARRSILARRGDGRIDAGKTSGNGLCARRRRIFFRSRFDGAEPEIFERGTRNARQYGRPKLSEAASESQPQMQGRRPEMRGQEAVRSATAPRSAVAETSSNQPREKRQ